MGDGRASAHLMKAVKLHESMEEVHQLLKDWEVLRLIEPILQPFMKAQQDLDGVQCVTGSMTIEKMKMAELREGLEAAIIDLKAVARGSKRPRQRRWKRFVRMRTP